MAISKIASSGLLEGAVTAAVLDSGNSNGTGAVTIPVGTTAQRPSSPTNGMSRFNTTIGTHEVYLNGAWVYSPLQAVSALEITYLMVGGGGGSSNAAGYNAGGGGGGVIIGKTPVYTGASYSIVVGAGGSVTTSGSNTLFSAVPGAGAYGGGSGGSYGTAPGTGGSGGGNSYNGTISSRNWSGNNAILMQGNYGGAGYNWPSGAGTGGGGGAGGIGADSSVSNSDTSSHGGNGGAGVLFGLTSSYYGGGGGGGAQSNTGPIASGGLGGGGNAVSSGTPNNGTANTGGGGGGAGVGAGGSGGSGVVIIAYPGTQRGTGGTITTVNSFTVHTFTTSGTFTFTG